MDKTLVGSFEAVLPLQDVSGISRAYSSLPSPSLGLRI